MARNIQLYNPSHPRQQAITEAVIQDLIIDCSLPLSLVEKSSFRHFMSVLDPKYNPVSRGKVTTQLTHLVLEKEATIKNKLSETNYVSATVDIWSDRTMRGFLGVTAHYMDMGRNGASLKSVLLSCDRFTGSHSGERISEKFEQICENYSIKQKLDYIICDNASNMRKAFTVCFPATTSNEAEDVDDSNLWEEMDRCCR